MLFADSGDRDSRELSELYEKRKKHVTALICRRLGISFAENRELAEDLTEEVFLKVVRYKSRFVGQTEHVHNANLMMMTQNVTADYIRKNARRPKITLFPPSDDGGDGDESEAGDGGDRTDPLTVLLRTEGEAATRRAVENLGSPAREIVVERYYFDRTYREIAEEHGMTTAAVGLILHKSLKKLGKELKDYAQTED